MDFVVAQQTYYIGQKIELSQLMVNLHKAHFNLTSGSSVAFQSIVFSVKFDVALIFDEC